MRKLYLSLVMALVISVTGCQTTGTTPGGSPSDQPTAQANGRISKEYSFFYDQGDHLNELIEVGDFELASRLYAEQKDFFISPENKAKFAPKLQSLADEMNKRFVPAMKEILQRINSAPWPAPVSQWNDLREALEQGRERLDRYDNHAILTESAYRAPEADRLHQTVNSTSSTLEKASAETFLGFDHFGGNSFFTTFPVKLDSQQFFADHPTLLGQILKGKSTTSMAAFARANSESTIGTAAWQDFSDRFTSAKSAELKKKGSSQLAAALGAIATAKAYDLKPSKKNALKIAFIEVTSKTLLKEGAIDFPAAIDQDLPIQAVKADLDSVLSGKAAADADYVIVFDVALATVRRRVTGIEKKPSRTVVGYRTEANPERTTMQLELSRAQMELNEANVNRMSNSASSAGCYGLGCLGYAFAGAIHASEADNARKKVESIMQNMNATPMTIEVPMYQSYKYDLAKIRGKKTMTVHYYVIDRRNKKYFKSTFDIVEQEAFEVAYRIDDNDPKRETNIAAHHTEQDVVNWEKDASTIKLSSLINHYLTHQKASKPLPSHAELRQAMLRDKNLALKKYKEQTYEGSTQSDPRFDSVVVVFNPAGSMGSGFFVRPDVVITNYHVVEEQNFVEMRLYDKQETFGKVIARDAGLDLALVKVQTRGKPVEFFGANKIELGSTVEVIGHPRGYEFSITRGVVSAVRRGNTAVVHAGEGTLQIQIDAATSPGNSGGPVFLKNKVVGVVSWGRVDQGSENLNFIIHYSEAEAFLKRELDGQS